MSVRRQPIHNYDSDRLSKDGGTRPKKNEFRCHTAPLECDETVFGHSRSIFFQPILHIHSSIFRRMEAGPLESAVPLRHNLLAP